MFIPSNPSTLLSFNLRHFTNFCVTWAATFNDENIRITENLVCCRCCFCSWLHFLCNSLRFIYIFAVNSSICVHWFHHIFGCSQQSYKHWNHMPHSQIARHPRFNYTHTAKQCPRAKRFHLIKNCVVICNKFSFRLMLIEYTSFHWAKQTKLRIYIIAALDTSIHCKIY